MAGLGSRTSLLCATFLRLPGKVRCYPTFFPSFFTCFWNLTALPAFSLFSSLYPLMICFSIARKSSETNKKIKIKHFCLYQDLHCKPLFSSSYAKRKHKTITVILQKRLSKKHLKDGLSVTFPHLCVQIHMVVAGRSII